MRCRIFLNDVLWDDVIGENNAQERYLLIPPQIGVVPDTAVISSLLANVPGLHQATNHQHMYMSLSPKMVLSLLINPPIYKLDNLQKFVPSPY